MCQTVIIVELLANRAGLVVDTAIVTGVVLVAGGRVLQTYVLFVAADSAVREIVVTMITEIFHNRKCIVADIKHILNVRLDSKPFISYLAGYTQGLAVKTTQEVKSLFVLTCFSHINFDINNNNIDINIILF